MFLIVIIYAFIWGMSLCGAISLIKGGKSYAGMDIAYGIAQIILFISITIFQWIQ